MSGVFSDESIIEALQGSQISGRNDVLVCLYKQHYDSILQFVLRNSGSEDDAADVFQDALVIFYQKVRSSEFHSKSSIKTYLYAVARNLWLNKLRKRTFDLSKLEVEESYSFDDEAIIQTSRLTMHDALEQIGATCKKLLIDFYYNKLSMQSIMETYGLSSNEAARNKKYRCLQRLMTFVRKNKLKRTDFRDE